MNLNTNVGMYCVPSKQEKDNSNRWALTTAAIVYEQKLLEKQHLRSITIQLRAAQ